MAAHGRVFPMRMRYTPKIFLSVDSVGLTNEETVNRHFQFNRVAQSLKLDCQQVTGKYNGVQETSYLMPDTEQNRRIAMQAMEEFNQECILLQCEEGFGTLLYKDGTRKKIGSMKVSNTKPQGDYTYIAQSREYVTFN